LPNFWAIFFFFFFLISKFLFFKKSPWQSVLLYGVRFYPKKSQKKLFKILGRGWECNFFGYLFPSFPKINSKNIARNIYFNIQWVAKNIETFLVFFSYFENSFAAKFGYIFFCWMTAPLATISTNHKQNCFEKKTLMTRV
jgi:hypothetical protein